MKKIAFILAIPIILFSCTENPANSQEKKSTQEKNVSTRDISITKESSYSDLFLDTSAVSSFITQNKVADSIARRLKAFTIHGTISLRGSAAMDLPSKPGAFGTCMIT